MSNIFIGLKKDLFGCFRIDEIRGKDNETGLKEGGGIKILTTVLPLRDARSLRLKILTSCFFNIFCIFFLIVTSQSNTIHPPQQRYVIAHGHHATFPLHISCV